MDLPVLIDVLLVATLAGTGLLAAAMLLGRLARRSAHLEHQILFSALLGGVTVFALTAAFHPTPIGCLAHHCAIDRERADRAAQIQQYHTSAAARKFPDLTPPRADAAVASESSAGVAAADGVLSSLRLDLLLVVLWLGGTTVMLLRLARSHWLARRFVADAARVKNPELQARFAELTGRLDLPRPVRLLEHAALSVPVVHGTLRPALLLPVDADAGPEADMVFLHELAHLKLQHPLLTLISELACAVFWFNPVAWLALRRLRALEEVVADGYVLRSGIRPSSYAQYLVEISRALARAGTTFVPRTVAIVGECGMDFRVRTILDPQARRGIPRRSQTIATGLGFVVLCLALTFAPTAVHSRGLLAQDAPSPGLKESLLSAEALDSILRPIFIDHMADRFIAGSAISVVHAGELIYSAGFGRREVFQELPVAPDRTIWRIGSITKVLTGLAVMQLVDRGLLDLEADVNSYLSDLQVPRTFEEPVRVRHLLTHTAGFDQIGLARHVSSRDEVRPLGDFLAEYLVRIRPPDEVSTYDTYGVTLAGYLIEQVTGLSYEEYLKTRIFQPLAMHRSAIVIPPALRTDAATGYSFAGHWEAAPWEFMNTDPASTVNSTATDMANLLIMFLEKGRFGGRQILSEASTAAMLTQQWTNHPDQPGYGYIFFEDRSFGIPAFSHGGSMRGFSALLYLVPEHQLGVFIADNQGSGSLHTVVLTALIDALFPGRQEVPEVRPTWDGPVDVTRFTGTYANSLHHHGNPATGWRRRPFELEADEEGRLVFQDIALRPVGPLAFQGADGLLVTFREDVDRRITYMFVNQTVYERLYPSTEG